MVVRSVIDYQPRGMYGLPCPESLLLWTRMGVVANFESCLCGFPRALGRPLQAQYAKLNGSLVVSSAVLLMYLSSSLSLVIEAIGTYCPASRGKRERGTRSPPPALLFPDQLGQGPCPASQKRSEPSACWAEDDTVCHHSYLHLLRWLRFNPSPPPLYSRIVKDQMPLFNKR